MHDRPSVLALVPAPLSVSRSPRPLCPRRDLRRSALRLSQYTCFSPDPTTFRPYTLDIPLSAQPSPSPTFEHHRATFFTFPLAS